MSSENCSTEEQLEELQGYFFDRKLKGLTILKRRIRGLNVYLDGRKIRSVSVIKHQIRGDDLKADMFCVRKRRESVTDLALAISKPTGYTEQQGILPRE
jgi:hypothetical protein